MTELIRVVLTCLSPILASAAVDKPFKSALKFVSVTSLDIPCAAQQVVASLTPRQGPPPVVIDMRSISIEICRKDIRLMSPFSKDETGHGS